MYVCVICILFDLALSPILYLDFQTVPTVWYLLFVILLHGYYVLYSVLVNTYY
jgi:hypothetical protein